MKATLITVCLAVLGLVGYPLVSSAASVIIQNYFYAHANTAGTFQFKDKYGATAWYGDELQHDASILSIYVVAEGMAAGDQLIATSSGGNSYPITVGGLTEVSIGANQTLSIKLIKTGNNEVFARIDSMNTFDASDGGTNVNYMYSVNDIPTEYGDLGPGSGGGDGGENVSVVSGNHYYFAERDIYKYDYTKPVGATRYELHYLYPNGTTQYKRDYEQAPTGIHYLTCNGTYEMRFFNGSGQLIAKSPLMNTTEMIQPICASTSGDGGYQDFTANKTKNSDSSVNISWSPAPGAAIYEIYKDGQKIGETTDTNYTGPDGNHSIIAKDGSGNIVGQTDLPPATAGNPDPGEGECGDVCQQIRDAMACPEWDQYMGEWTNAIKAALPPPPDWDLIADKIGSATIRHLADYMGDVPDVPTKEQIANEITPPLPQLDTSVPVLNPNVPSDFNQPMPFDITTGQEIPVVDESQPLEIYDPDKYIDSDDPGEMVFPGDSRNHSDGIKQPDRVDTGYTQPTPSIPDNEVPPTDIPIPSGSGSTTPIPTDPGGIIPIPTGGVQPE
jgi:hypothetical protein